MQEWRLLITGSLKGSLNMAVDEAIALSVAEGTVPPTLRFYGWDPACLSLGYAQRAAEVNWDACLEHGIDVVRRATGGRAILHDQEVTYSIAAPEDNPLVSGSILESYLKISQGLLFGLRKLGINAEIVSNRDMSALGTAACFDSPSFYEMVINGKKAVGSAQTRKNGVLLQHGSIIREMNVDLLFAVLAFPNEELRSRMQHAFMRKACCLQQATERKLTDVDIIGAVTEGFRQAFDIRLEETGLSAAEEELARELVQTKYGTAEWTNKR